MVFVTCTNFQTMPCSSKSFYRGDKIVSTNRQMDRLFKYPPQTLIGGGGIIRFATDINPVSFLIF